MQKLHLLPLIYILIFISIISCNSDNMQDNSKDAQLEPTKIKLSRRK